MQSDPYERQYEPLMIVISGPSGVGKDTLIQRMRERGLPFHFVVTANTRARRPNEVDGVDYIFVTRQEFLQMLEQDELIEHAKVYDDFKGVPKAQVRDALSSGQDVVMRLDVQGAATIKDIYPEAVLVFLTTRSEDELIQRLKKRGTETAESLELRMQTARKELGQMERFDYFVINADMQLEAAVDTFLAIIQAEHHRTCPRKVSL